MKNLVRLSLVLATVAILLSGCNCLHKMTKKINNVQASCAPAVLTKKGNNISADVTVSFPAKYFNENAVIKVTPVLVYEGGETAGTPKFIQGKSVKDNYTVIDWKQGGSYSQTITFPYEAKYNNCTLELRMEAKCFNACSKKVNEFSKFLVVPVAVGTSTIQDAIDYSAFMVVMDDQLQRVTSTTENADVMFLINKSNVRKDALSTESLTTLKNFVADNTGKERTSVSPIYSKGYASPDGPLAFNDKLAKARSESAQKAVSTSTFKDIKDAKYDISAYGEDWSGFKALVEKSDMKDKDLILQVLQMYSDPAQRDRELMNMSSAFQVLAKDVLPKLRRSVISSTVDVAGKTDEEILALAISNPDGLTVEEVLFADKLVKNPADKAKMYSKVASKLNDARVYNNYGVALAQTGDYKGATDQLQKASKLANAPAVNDNLGFAQFASGNTEAGKKLLASSSNPNAKAAVAVANGDYAPASKAMKGYNKAVADVCNGDLKAAKAAISNDNSANAEYLKAVIAAKEGDANAALANLKSAIAKNPALKAKAAKDVEFAKIAAQVKAL